MKKIILFLLFLSSFSAYSQTLFKTDNGYIAFFSSTPLEDIKAENKKVISVLNITTGKMVFKVPIKSFKFSNSLMEEHFNENYLETEKYPYAEFSGLIQDVSNVNFAKDGKYAVKVSGNLTMHGVTKAIASDGALEVANGNIRALSKFMVKLEDYNIEIPTMVFQKISETVEVTVDIMYQPHTSAK